MSSGFSARSINKTWQLIISHRDPDDRMCKVGHKASSSVEYLISRYVQEHSKNAKLEIILALESIISLAEKLQRKYKSRTSDVGKITSDDFPFERRDRNSSPRQSVRNTSFSGNRVNTPSREPRSTEVINDKYAQEDNEETKVTTTSKINNTRKRLTKSKIVQYKTLKQFRKASPVRSRCHVRINQLSKEEIDKWVRVKE